MIKKIGGVVVVLVVYYALQYGASAVHYNCHVIKDDCVPPINGVSELIYRTIVKPYWLEQFESSPTTYTIGGEQYRFWQGSTQNNGKPVILRAKANESAVLSWIAAGLPLGTPITPASGDQVLDWMREHNEF